MAEETQGKVPEIRFSGFTGVWEDTTLGEALPITSAARVHKNEWTKSGVRFFRSSDVVSHYKGNDNEKAFISKDLYRELTEKIGLIHKGDILITGGGSIGIPYLVETDEPLYFKDADLLWLKVRDAIDSKFLYTYFSAKPFRKHVKSISHIGTIAHYTVEQAKGTPIKLPAESDEQSRIGQHFAKLDEMISQHQRKHAKLVALKKAMLQKMFPRNDTSTPEIRFKGFSGDWEEKALGDLVDVCSGRDYKHLSDGNIPVYGTGGYMLSVNEALSWDQDAIGIGRKGTIDKPYVLKAPFWTVDTLFYAVPQNDNDIDFIHCLFQSIKWKKLDESTGVPSLSKVTINEVQIMTASPEEQQKIGRYFVNLDELTLRHATQITKLRNIKAACLEKMFV